MVNLTVSANGQIIGEYDAGTQAELAFQVAEACARKRQAVTVFDGTDYIYSDGSKSDNPRTRYPHALHPPTHRALPTSYRSRNPLLRPA